MKQTVKAQVLENSTLHALGGTGSRGAEEEVICVICWKEYRNYEYSALS
jgi:hypothetical protein